MKTYLSVGLILTLYLFACQKVPPLVTDGQTQSSLLLRSRYNQDSAKKAPDTTKKPADSTKPKPPADTTQVPFPQTVAAAPPAPSCPVLPIYGDTIIFTQPTGGSDYIVNPLNNPGPGKYFSWPQGMTLDPNTGAINLSKSETGMKYAIGFVKAGTTDTCLSTLVIGGAAYEDSVYVLSSGSTTASPYFEANPYLPSVCAGGGCTFDVNGAAARQKVIVDPATGVIDLQKTLNGSGLLSLGGAFGLLPTSGQVLLTTIYYRLNDPSNNALQHIDVQLVYYANKSNMNPGLLSGLVNKLDNLLSGNLISTTTNPRPPMVVIVRNF